MIAACWLVQLDARAVEVLTSVGGLPVHVAGMFEEPLQFQQSPSGRYFVFDRRAHAVYLVDRERGEATRIVDVGPEQGRLLGPTAFDTGPHGIFAIADAPNRVERIQFFNEQGQRVGSFRLPGRASARVTLGTLVLSGVGSLQYTGRSVLINQPETGGLVTEYGLAGTPVRTFGQLRPTGHERDRDLHLAFNVGLPLVDPTGGYYFVFLTGEPRFRKYDPEGRLVFERLMQGRELDELLRAMPTSWPRREVNDESLPIVPPIVRAAAVDRDGRLWVSLVTPFTYVFNGDGDKVRTVQFRAAGLLAPTSLSFALSGRLLVTPGLYEFDVR
ncbi:MAG: hypothetical protein KJ066_18065 [Acidobacteria bacterium]|nr:hypothetical protein [Acidobacteriota bacterium]